MKFFRRLVVLIFLIYGFEGLLFSEVKAQTADQFQIVENNSCADILVDTVGVALDSIIANNLADDIALVTGIRPSIKYTLDSVSGNVIIIGNAKAALVGKLLKSTLPDYDRFVNQWESFCLTVLKKPFKHVNKTLLIAGSDKRGTAYGVFTVSEQIGVTPWYWWADIKPKQQQALSVSVPLFLSEEPSVKYRGIFINDEDWGLQPWAAKTFEPEQGDIGPRTYAKVFELLLRLKANLLWPAMHPSTIP